MNSTTAAYYVYLFIAIMVCASVAIGMLGSLAAGSVAGALGVLIGSLLPLAFVIWITYELRKCSKNQM